MIKGVPVILCVKEKIGVDPFNQPIYKETEKVIEDVLIAPSSTDDIATSTDLVGKRAVYTLGIPKSDNNIWENQKVKFYGETWLVYGFTIKGMEENIPLRWNKKVMVERYG